MAVKPNFHRGKMLLRIVTVLCALQITYTATALRIEEMVPKMRVTLSRGAAINQIDHVIIYTTIQYLVFMIPDLPDPPRVTKSQCSKVVEDKEACEIFENLQNAVKDVNDVLVTHNRVLTTKGARVTEPADVDIPNEWLNVVSDVNVRSNRPSETITAMVSDDWLSDTEMQLALRQIISNPSEVNAKTKRWIHNFFGPVLKFLGAGFAFDKIEDLFSNMFVGDNAILQFLTSYKATTKDEYKAFADLPKRVSELQVETKRLLQNLLNSTETVKLLSQNVKIALQTNDEIMTAVEDAFFLEQATIADIISNLYTSAVYNLHFSAYDECRTSQIPSAFVPPALLRERLVEIETTLPNNIKFAIPLDEIQRYYKMSLAECIYDSSGGVVRVAVPLIEKDAKYSLYKFQPYDFSHEDHTCSVQATSSYVIKEHNTNAVTVISYLDDDSCDPLKGYCLVPYSQSEGSANFCLETLLSNEPAHLVKENCKLDCRPDTRPTLSQITPDTFVGIHLPENVRVECPNASMKVNNTVANGSVRIKVPCDCAIWMDGRLMGKSTARACNPPDKPEVDILLPVQMSRLQDILPFSAGAGHENTVFSDVDEIYNPNFNLPNTMDDDDWFNEDYAVTTSFVWQFIHSMLILYLYTRTNLLAAAAITASENLPLTEAAGKSSMPNCILPNEAYYLLVANLVVASLAIIPGIILRVCGVVKKAYTKNVELAAQQLAFQDKF